MQQFDKSKKSPFRSGAIRDDASSLQLSELDRFKKNPLTGSKSGLPKPVMTTRASVPLSQKAQI